MTLMRAAFDQASRVRNHADQGGGVVAVKDALVIAFSIVATTSVGRDRHSPIETAANRPRGINPARQFYGDGCAGA
jgi:hypothetical protein